ncbi:hypothetical protein [Pontimicrobium sp. IMCC45349]|uniref:hypothetical protein n=1 Tax=Pontimicrobium sp. IMCC45349 TaxID=3391574 RepID=UPI0039A22017
MGSFKTIQNKLEQFIKRYYTNELLKGAILFFAIGLLYFLFTLFVEYLLWLSPLGRTILFWIFIAVEFTLFLKFILTPLARLFKLQKGINYEEASVIIGNHFPEVNDKLLNVLQLNQNSAQSELLIASIEQKSKELNPIPFKLAVNFKSNTKYLKYAAVPLLIILGSYLSGKVDWFSDSYERVVNYQTAYEPPAPYQFFILNNDLQAIENKDFTLLVKTEGDVVPDNVQITYNEEIYFLKQKETGTFEYVFTQPRSSIDFNVFSDNVSSKTYTLNILQTPTLLGFDMVLDYPSHTKKKDETLKSIGNAVVPQGTKITWQLNTKATENVTLITNDTILEFNGSNNKFNLSKRLYNNFDYSLNTSNESLKDYESLAFSIDVIKDQYPELNLQMKQDSTDVEIMYFYGQVSDDYGLSKLNLVYYPINEETKKETVNIPISNQAFDEFVNVFPDNLNLEGGKAYELYFEVFDNDALSNFKSTKSNTYSFRKLTQDEKKENQLQEQSKTIEDLNNSLEKLESQEEELKELSKTQKEKSELNFNDKKKLENFLKRQKQQEEMMQNFNKKLQENLEQFQNENEDDQFKEDLKERLNDNQEQLKKDEELLKELEKLSEKIDKEELSQKLEELAKQNKNKKRSLEQLVELTKRYYVAQKTEKLKEDLEKLAEEQEKLSEESQENNTKEKQDELNKKFEDFQEELEDLRKENNELKEPIEVPNDKKGEEDIKKDQQEASENLEKKEESQNQEQQQNNQNNAQKNQKKAAQKMKQMSEQMSNMMMGGASQQMGEDIDMLRQILDNLVLFSFNQEDLMNTFRGLQINHNEYAKHLRTQQSLREHFEHIDDSLFALSLRQPMISEVINKEITETFFNIDKSLSQLAENRLYQGVAAQQYTVTSANTLANFLSDVLDNMEMQMNPSPGQGQGDMQLPDIIMSQEQLNKQMQQQMDKKEGEKNGEQEGDKKGEKPQPGNKEGKQQGEGNSNSEELNGELFEIYQRQQELRQALQDRLAKEGNSGSGQNLLKKMEEVELDLLNKGFTNQTLQKMMALQHQLLKLENATFQQGEEQKRKSTTNTQQFNNNTNNQIPNIKQYFNTTEILNRQALPLQQVYKKKVQTYFKKTND